MDTFGNNAIHTEEVVLVEGWVYIRVGLSLGVATKERDSKGCPLTHLVTMCVGRTSSRAE